MPDLDHEPPFKAEQGRVLIRNARYEEEIVQRTLGLIERSRALLEETKHLVRHPLIGIMQTGGKQTS